MMDRLKPNLRRGAVTMLISFTAGVLAGLAFWALHEPSPAPPWRALTGLLGIVAGEQLVTRIRHRLRRQAPRQDTD